MVSNRITNGLTNNHIELYASELRYKLGVSAHQYLDMLDLLEVRMTKAFPSFETDIVADDSLGGDPAVTYPDDELIALTISTHEGLQKRDREASFIVGHELGHLILHECLPKKWSMQREQRNTQLFRTTEWQADQFSLALMSPRHLVERCQSASEVATQFGLPDRYASKRFRQVDKRGRELPESVKQFIDARRHFLPSSD